MIGWVLLDKAEGISSAAALGRVKRSLGVKKAGHAGTLDPAASGLLLIAIGEACKFLSVLNFVQKSYQFTLHWGESTTTDDAEGELLRRSNYCPTETEIRASLQTFIGSYAQSPPAFSALKVNGTRAYTLARAGKLDRLPPREVRIFDLHLISHDREAEISTLAVTFGKGGYVRALGRDIAETFGQCGHVQQIRRLRIGNLTLDNAIPLACFENFTDKGSEVCSGWVLELESVLDDIPALDVSVSAQLRLAQGKYCALDLDTFTNAESFVRATENQSEKYILRHQGCIFGLGAVSAFTLKPKRLLQQKQSL